MAIFPGGIATDADLYRVVDNFETTLNGAIDDTQTTITLTSTAGLPTVGILTIEDEKVKYTGISVNDITGVTRGFSSTTAVAHADTTAVRFFIVEEHHNATIDEIEAIETQLFTHSADVFSYKKPDLYYENSSTVGMISGLNGVANDVVIIFPDGNKRTDSSSTRVFCNFGTQAVLSGSATGGLYGTNSADANSWYAMYAVKVTDSATNFVLVADHTLPLQTNFATLNSRYGTDDYVYLGMIRYGNNSNHTTEVLYFEHTKNRTSLYHSNASSLVRGILLTNGSTADFTYSNSRGTGNTDIPNHFREMEIAAFGVDVLLKQNGGFVDKIGDISSVAGTTAFVSGYMYASTDYRAIVSTGTVSMAFTGWIDPMV